MTNRVCGEQCRGPGFQLWPGKIPCNCSFHVFLVISCFRFRDYWRDLETPPKKCIFVRKLRRVYVISIKTGLLWEEKRLIFCENGNKKIRENHLSYVGPVKLARLGWWKNLQAKSLRFFVQKYNPGEAIRTSMSDYREEEWMINLPLYAISELTGEVG